MLEEDALIVDLEDGFIWVEAMSQSSCNHCSANQGCGTASLQKWFNRSPNRLRMANKPGFSVGDKVVIGIPEQALVKGSLMIYMFPLLALIAGAMLGALVNDWLGWDFKEVASIIAGFASFAVCFRSIQRYTLKFANRADYQPILLRLSH